MSRWNFLRLFTRPPQKLPPPEGCVDMAYDPETGKIHAKNSASEEVLFNGTGSGGEVSTDDLTTTDGSGAAGSGKLGQIASQNTFTNSLVDGIAESVCDLEVPAGEWDLQATVTWESASATTTSRLLQLVDDGLSSQATVAHSWFATTSSLDETDSTKLVRVRNTTARTYSIRVTAGFSAGAVNVLQATLEARRVR